MTDHPPPHTQLDVPLEDGATVSVRAYGAGPRLVMSHGNGLAIDAYRSFWSRFVASHEVVIFDVRHHGQSSPYAGALRNWPQMIADFEVILAAIQARLGQGAAVGVFHSMSALTAMLHASMYPAPWRSLVVFEPPVPPPAGSPQAEGFAGLHETLAAGADRRRTHFDDPSDLVRSFRRHGAFDRIADGELDDLVRATLRPDAATGGFALACDRGFEAETFRLRHLQDPWGRVTSLALPVTVVSSDPDSGGPAILPAIAEALAQAGGYAHRRVPDSTHFLQLERPQDCERIVREALVGAAARPGTPGASAA